MKALKSFLFLTILFGVFSLSAKAQPSDSSPGKTAPIRTARALYVKLDQELNFTPEQREGVYNVLIARSVAWQKQVKRAPNANKVEEIAKVNKKADDELSTILTKEQIAKHKELRQKAQKSKKNEPQAPKKGALMYDEAEMDF